MSLIDKLASRLRLTRCQNATTAGAGILFERLEDRVLLNAVPDVSIDVVDQSLVGETVGFEITFDLPNSATGPGFGPFVDVVLDRNGADGNAGMDTPDGLGTQDVTFDFFGSPLTPVFDELVPADGMIVHPLLRNPDGSPTVVTGLTPGDRFIVLQLPLGSYEPATIPLTINGTANVSELADVGVALPIDVRGGFQFGCDPLDNPSVDDPNATVSAFNSDTTTPEVVLINKIVNADENETATGFNFPKSYTIELNIADGQTVTDLDVRDPISNRIVYLNRVVQGGMSPDAGTGTIVEEPTIGDANSLPQNGEQLVLNYLSAEGTADTNDLSVRFDFFVPEFDADGNPIIDHMTGAPTITQNSALAEYDWDPIDMRDDMLVGETVEDPLDGEDQELTNRSLAVQKEVDIVNQADPNIDSPAPGDVLEYRIEFQISDYFDFQQLIVNDEFSDGQTLDPSFTPQLQIRGNNGNPSALSDFAAANFTVSTQTVDPFGSDLQFRVSNELMTRGQTGVVEGNDGLTPGTTGLIVYRTIVSNTYTNPNNPINGEPVTEGDSIGNKVEVSGVVDKGNGETGDKVTDGSESSVSVPAGEVNKEVYAVNQTIFDTNPPPGPVPVGPGDTLTYRIEYDLPQTRFQNLVIRDTLPQPIFDASTITIDTFDSVLGAGQLPAVGEITYGPNATDFFNLYFGGAGLEPQLMPGPGNSFELQFGAFAATPPVDTTIDLLFTVQFGDIPFADGLFLANLVTTTQTSTDGSVFLDGDLPLIISQTPELNLTKGVVSTEPDQSLAVFDPATVGPVMFADPGQATPAFVGAITSPGLVTSPVDSNLENIDAGDLVKFAIVVENTGSDDGFDVTVNETLPDGFIVPTSPLGLNLQVTRGDGLALTFTDAFGGAITPGTEADFFIEDPSNMDPMDPGGRGIRVIDPADTGGSLTDGAIDAGNGNTGGSNIIVYTFDLQAADDFEACTKQIDTGTLVRFAAINDGINWTEGVEGPFQDTAMVTGREVLIEKELTGTGILSATNAFDEAVIGETITYTITVTIPEGVTTDLKVIDDFSFSTPGEIAFVRVDDIRASTDLSTSIGNGVIDEVNIVPTVEMDDQLVTFDLGIVTNDNRDNTAAEEIVFEITAVVLNDIDNQSGVDLVNAASVNYLADGAPKTDQALSEIVTVIEPDVEVLKSVTINGVPPGTGDANDVVQYTITIQHSGASETDAFELQLNDPIPLEIANPSVIMVTDNGPMPLAIADFAITGPNQLLQFSVGATNEQEIEFLLDETTPRVIEVVVEGTIAQSVVPDQKITNTANIEWTSLKGDPDPIIPTNPASGERTGENGPGNGLNNYADNDMAMFTITALDLVKSLDATSEDHTGIVGNAERVAIGEIVRYRLVTTVPEATYNNTFIRDRLPNGMTFLNDGTTTVAFVGDNPNLFNASAFPAGDFQPPSTLFILDMNQPIGSIEPTYVLDPGQISTGPNGPPNFTQGVDPYFELGNVINLENDPDLEYIIIEFNALVNNVGGNQMNRPLDNRFNWIFDGQIDQPRSNRVRIRVAEPDITVDKMVDVAPVDAGDTVEFGIDISNGTGNNTTTGFDIRLIDTLDPNLILDSVTIDSAPAGTTVTINPSSPPGVVDVSINRLDPNATVELTIEATVIDTASAGLMIPNEAEITYTSLPGLRGTAPNPTGSILPADPSGDPGNINGERTGQDNPNEDGLNNYFDSDDVKVTLDIPKIEKFVDPNLYTIGETIDYDILVTLPEGITEDFEFTDNLPVGLEFVSFNLITDASSSPLLTENYAGILTPQPVVPPVGSGQDLVIDFGDTLTFADGRTTNNSFVIEVEARVLNELGNQNTVTLTNVAEARYTNPNGGATDLVTGPVDITIIEPDVQIDKEILSPIGTNPDAGDIITYKVTIDHTTVSTSDAFEVAFRDAAPNNTLITGIVSVTPMGFGTTTVPTAEIVMGGAGIILSDIPGMAGMPGNGEFDLPLGATLELVYQVTIQDSVGPGEMIMNQALIDWTSLDGDVDPGQLRGERDGSSRPDVDGLNNYFDDDKTTITTAIPTIDKEVFSSTVPSTIGPDLVIGEQVTFRITVTLPEASYPSPFVVTDLLPTLPGMQGELELVDAVFRDDLSDANIGFTTLVIDDTQTDQATFTFTDLVNPPTGNNLLIFDVTAVVPDIAENMNGDMLTNEAILTYTGFTDNSTADVKIVEPILTITKDSNVQVASVGDTVTYTVVVTNDRLTGSTAAASDLVITDDLLDGLGFDDTLDLVTGTVMAMSSGAGVVNVTQGNMMGDTTIEVTVTTLELDQSVTIMFDAVVNDNVDPTGDMIVNTSKVKFDSLPGDGGREDQEQDDNKITTPQQPVGIEKTIIDTSEPTTGSGQFDPDIIDLAIGEIVTYEVTIELPAGRYNDPVVVTDQLPDFLALLNGDGDIRIDRVGGDITLGGLPTIVTDDMAGNDGYDDQFTITFDIDRVSLPLQGMMPDTEIVIQVDAQVLNVDGNQATGVPLTNTAMVMLGSFTDDASVDVELVEPELDLEKEIIGFSANPPDAGDTVSYRITLQHTGDSTSDALNTMFSDVAPMNTLITSIDSFVANGFNVNAPAPTPQITGGGTGIQLNGATAGEFDMPLGATITLEYSITLQDTVTNGQVLTNDAFVDWTSLSGNQNPGAETGERDGSGAPNTGSLNNYFDADQETITVIGSLELDKSVLNGTDFAIGDTVEYQLEVSISEGLTPDLLIIDDVPAIFSVDTNSVTVIAGNNFQFSAPPMSMFDGDKLTIELGDVTNVADNDPANDSFLITYEAVVLNDAANQNGDMKPNFAEATSSNNLTDDADAKVNIVEPFLQIVKTINDDTPNLGDIVTYQYVITHTGASTTDAYDLIILDTLPPDVTLDPTTIVVVAPAGSVVTDMSTGNTVNVTVDELLLGDKITVTFDAKVTEDIAAYGTMFVNTVTLDWDSQPGTNPEQRPDSTDDMAKATIVGPDLEILKETQETVLLPGQVYTYTFTVTNKTGPFADVATNAIVTDQLPAGVTFVSSSSQFFVGDDPTAGTVTWLIPTLAIGEQVTIDMTVQLDDPAPPTEIICNIVGVIHDDIDPTPADNIDDEKTPIDPDVTPDLTITKDDGRIQVFPGDVITYQIIVTNVGPQTAKGVVVTDLFPDDVLNFVSASDGGIYDPATAIVQWQLGELAGNGGQVTLTLTGTVKTVGVDPTIMEFTNFVGVRDDGSLGPDPTPGNNFDSDTDKVTFYGKDSFNDFLEDPREPLRRLVFPERITETYLTGIADPGTTLYLEIRDGTGQLIGWKTTVADAGGNYAANLAGIRIDSSPHNTQAWQTPAGYSRDIDSGYNLRRYYEPTPPAATYFSGMQSLSSVFAGRSSQVLHSMQSADERPIQLTDLGSSSRYESRVASILPASR